MWNDVYLAGECQIQRHVRSNRFRLRVSGKTMARFDDFEPCHALLKQDYSTQATASHPDLVILVHGILHSGRSFEGLASFLRSRDHQCFCFSYASMHAPLETHAADLADLLCALTGIERVSFISHSMGSLVVREALSSPDVQALPIRFDRMVMIAPPYQGSDMAEWVCRLPLPKAMLPPVTKTLTPSQACQIAPTDLELAIIKGAFGNRFGFNPFLKGDNDGVVRLSETRADRRHQSMVVRAPHGLVVDHPKTKAAVAAFLETGFLRSAV